MQSFNKTDEWQQQTEYCFKTKEFVKYYRKMRSGYIIHKTRFDFVIKKNQQQRKDRLGLFKHKNKVNHLLLVQFK